MNLTLHLTERCNMDCAYCVHEKCGGDMSERVMLAACDLAFADGKGAGLCFFGGEPLLKKDMIYKALDYCEKKSAETGIPFRCKMTTNGTLLDEEFLERAVGAGMEIGLSFDGMAQDVCRRYADGRPTMADVERVAKMLLDKMPRSYAMLTLAPKAAERLCGSVEYLHDLGFRRVTGTIAYGKRVLWDEEQLSVLEREFEKTADYYERLFLAGERFYFSPFDAKIREVISGFNPSERCHLGYRQMPVSVDGRLYACTQFIGDEGYCFGDVFGGIDREKQIAVAKRSVTPTECRECALNKRCTNSCGCMNRLETGDENRPSAVQCAYERMLIRISDELGERLYEKEPERFAKRYA